MKIATLTNSTRLFGFVALALGCSAVALAGPVGDTFTVAGTNFPNTYAATPVTYDFIPELVGGAGGMLVNEDQKVSPGIPGGITASNKVTITAYQTPGIIAEFIFRSNSGGPYNGSPGAWGVSVADVDFGNGKNVNQPRSTTYYYFLDGTGAPMVVGPGGIATLAFFGYAVGPHPFNPGITQVVYPSTTSASVSSFPTGIVGFTLADSGSLNASAVGSLIFQNVIPAGIAVGSLNIVPEPSTWLMLAMGSIGLVALKRRKIRVER